MALRMLKELRPNIKLYAIKRDDHQLHMDGIKTISLNEDKIVTEIKENIKLPTIYFDSLGSHEYISSPDKKKR